MSNLLVALSTWLHTLATLVMVGYFLFAGLIYLPVFKRELPASDLGHLLKCVSAQLRPFFGGALLTFIVTGTHLMLVNPQYQGLGNFFANPWSVLIIIKHVLVLPFLALAIFSERVYVGQISDQRPAALQQFHLSLNINLALSALILFLTALAQAM